MAGQVKLNCPSGGSVTVGATDTSSNLTATFPAIQGTVAITGGSIENLTTFNGITIDGGTY